MESFILTNLIDFTTKNKPDCTVFFIFKCFYNIFKNYKKTINILKRILEMLFF